MSRKPINIQGQRFGTYTVIEYTGINKKWLCRCDCGKESLITCGNLRQGQQKMCRGCKHCNSPFKDLTGLKFGRWTVVRVSGRVYYKGRSNITWECVCDCGVARVVEGRFLKGGASKSCGCLKIEVDKTREMLPFGESAFNRLYDWSRDNAKRKGILFELTKEQYKSIVQHNCTYCGEPPKENHFKKTNGHFMANGVDRVDSSVGYVLNNCVPCCEDCNRMKMAHTVDYWLAHMIKVLEHYNSRNRVSVIKSVPIKNN